MRVGAAQRELARDKGARFLPPGYSYVNHQMWARRFRDTILPVGTYFWYKGQDHLWWLGNISAHTLTPGQYVVRFFGRPRTGQARALFSSVHYGSWSRSRLVVSTSASRKLPHAWYCTQR